MIKRLMLLALLPGVAHAADDFARQWPLQLSQPDAGAYRVVLDAQVHAAAHWRDLRDVQVLDADGKPVASVVQAAATPLSPPLRTRELAWFALPAAVAAGNDDLSVVVQRDAAGKLLSIRGASAHVPAAGVDPAWLLDVGQDAASLRALQVQWADADAVLDLGYRLEGSDDLRNWRVLDPQVRLLQLRNGGHQLRNARIAVAAASRYLRLLPLQAQGAPALAGIRGEFAAATEADDWQWLQLQASGGDARQGYVYQLQGRFPVQRVDVDMPANSALTWSLASRDGDIDDGAGGDGGPSWRVLASAWNTWNLSEAGSQRRSAALEMSATVEDRQWRLQAEPGAGPASAPLLRLGYRPASVVFLAQGRAPYLLVAGSANAGTTQATLEPMLAALRTANGAHWQPSIARLGPGSVRAGDAAYQRAAAPRDWKNLLLWAVLLAGALAVAGFAASLLRVQKRPPTPD